MRATTSEELKRAVKQNEAEIVVSDAALARRVQLWFTLRRVASIAVFVILGFALVVWANPLDFEFLRLPAVRLARQIALGVGIVLLFADYFVPVLRNYRVVSRDEAGLRLVNRKQK